MTVTEPTTDRAEWVARLTDHCREADLSPLQTQVTLLHLADGLPREAIRRRLRLQAADVEREWAQARAKLSGLPDFWNAAKAFPMHLLFCVENKRTYDDRPPGLRGVTPDRSSDRFQGARIVTSDDRRLRQGEDSAARLWVQSWQPVRDLAGAGNN